VRGRVHVFTMVFWVALALSACSGSSSAPAESVKSNTIYSCEAKTYGAGVSNEGLARKKAVASNIAYTIFDENDFTSRIFSKSIVTIKDSGSNWFVERKPRRGLYGSSVTFRIDKCDGRIYDLDIS
jgi:hypothetical protein